MMTFHECRRFYYTTIPDERIKDCHVVVKCVLTEYDVVWC